MRHEWREKCRATREEEVWGSSSGNEKIQLIWSMTPCRFGNICRRLGGSANYFHHSYLVWHGSNPDENNIFRVCPDRHRDPHGVKRAERGADHPPPSSAMLRMGTIYTFTSFLYVYTYVVGWPLPLISLKGISSYTFPDFLLWLQFDIFGVLLISFENRSFTTVLHFHCSLLTTGLQFQSSFGYSSFPGSIYSWSLGQYISFEQYVARTWMCLRWVITLPSPATLARQPEVTCWLLMITLRAWSNQWEQGGAAISPACLALSLEYCHPFLVALSLNPSMYCVV